MSNINSIDRIKLEKFFEMDSGYVCDFNNFTFEKFILEYTGINVYTDEYSQNGTSKARRLRYFWEKESNYLNEKLLNNMLEYWKIKIKTPFASYRIFDMELYNECLKIVSKLKNDNQIIDGVDALPEYSENENFTVLVDSIKENLRKNKHEYVLDWLHTYVVKYITGLCIKHSIGYTKDTPLHSMFGQYVRFLKEKGLIDSEMSVKILSSTIKILDDFNSVRNNNTFAHNNETINHAEGVLITNNIIHAVLFVQSLERLIDERKKIQNEENEEDEDKVPSDEEIEAAGDWYMEQLRDIARGK